MESWCEFSVGGIVLGQRGGLVAAGAVDQVGDSLEDWGQLLKAAKAERVEAGQRTELLEVLFAGGTGQLCVQLFRCLTVSKGRECFGHGECS